MNLLLNCINAAATFVTTLSVNGFCLWYLYQPEIPSAAMKSKK